MGDVCSTGEAEHFESVQVWKLASESEEFAQFLRDPSVPKKQKSKVLQDVLSDVKVSELTKNFFRAPLLSLLHHATERVLHTCLAPDGVNATSCNCAKCVCASGSGTGREQPSEPVRQDRVHFW